MLQYFHKTLCTCALFFLVQSGVKANRAFEQEVQDYITEQQFPGIVTLVRQGDKTLHHSAVGYNNLKKREPLQKDAIFRLYSMTKPIVTVAIMQLIEQGKLGLEDDIRTYLPELEPFEYDDREYKVTVHHLLSHTAGLGYFGGFRSWIDFQYLILDPNDPNGSSEELLEDISGISLKHKPGEMWRYSIANDVLGVLIERVSGQTLQAYLKQQVFEPLGMVDTGFWVPESQAHRLTDMYELEDGDISFSEHGHRSEYLAPPGLQSGGSGLVSTATDYVNFLSMLLNKGRFAGKHIISEQSIALMTTSYTDNMDTWFLPRLYPGAGYGYGVGVQQSDDTSRHPGSFFWAGRGGTFFWVDPQADLIVVGMSQLEDGWRRLDQWMQPRIYTLLE